MPGSSAKTVRLSPVRASNEPPAENAKPSFPTPVGTMFILALGANVVLQSPALRASVESMLNSTGLNGSTTQDGLATIEKSVLVAACIQVSTLQDPTSEISAESTA